MRLGIVKGNVVLSKVTPVLRGTRFLIVEPVTAENLAKDGIKAEGGGSQVVAADQLGPAEGQMIAMVEGREACCPWHPKPAAIDIYCSLVVDSVHYTPPKGA
jgi:microcompartment protein CcmK/EutM